MTNLGQETHKDHKGHEVANTVPCSGEAASNPDGWPTQDRKRFGYGATGEEWIRGKCQRASFTQGACAPGDPQCPTCEVADEYKRLEDLAFAAYRSTPAAAAWQDIASAPKDGTDVLLCWSDGIAAPMYAVGHNLGGGRRWQDVHDWLHNDRSWPTHWMPLKSA